MTNPRLSRQHREQLERAQALHRSGRLAEAAQRYEALLAELPAFPLVLTQLGTIALQTRKLEDGVRLIGESLRLDPRQPDALSNRGVALGMLGRFAEAVASFDSAISLDPGNVQALRNKGFALRELGRLEEAAAAMRQAIALSPEHADTYLHRARILKSLQRTEEALGDAELAAHYAPANPDAHLLTGTLRAALQSHEQALESFVTALRLRPDSVEALFNAGLSLGRLARFAEAVAMLERLVEVDPSNAIAHGNLGLFRHRAGDPGGAIEALQRCLSLPGNHAEAHSNFAVVLAEMDRPEEALAQCSRAIELAPAYADAINNRAVILKKMRRFDEALQDHARAIDLSPNSPDAYCNRAATLNALRRHDEALVDCARAVALQPEHAEGWNNRAVALDGLGDIPGALDCLARAIRLRPQYPEAFLNRASVMSRLFRFDEALADCDRAIESQPGYAEAHYARGTILGRLGRREQALAALARAMALKPDIDYLQGSSLHAAMTVCEWSDFPQRVARLASAVSSRRRVADPFVLLSLQDDPALVQEAAQTFARDRLTRVTSAPPLDSSAGSRKTKIGYFSADFHDHATMHLLSEVFERHDRSRFEILAFSFGPERNDRFRHIVLRNVDEFVDIRAMPHREVAMLSRRLQVDIAVDLKGFTLGSRPQIFAERAAPLQVNYLGYPGTMGADFIDYIVADRVLISDVQRRFITERVVYLPDSYQANAGLGCSSAKALGRAQVGLPEQGVVFCCFNNAYKILPDVFAAWMRLLARVQGSVLWLLDSDPDASRNLRKHARSHRIDEARLVFAPFMPRRDHLARVGLADLFLDTFPYNAHTTASDALRAGVPLVTRMGETFASRVASSLLSAVGMPELATRSLEDYEALALRLGSNPDELHSVRARLALRLPSSPLFDAARFTRNLERAYSLMHSRHLAGEAPDDIIV